MTQEDIKKYRDQIQYLASNEELKIFDSLTPEGKASFVVNFWRSRDTDPSTPENEFMLNYFSRIEYANTHFKGVNGGINTDMGRCIHCLMANQMTLKIMNGKSESPLIKFGTILTERGKT